MRHFLKKIWVGFTENLGTSIIHPQSTIIRFQKEAIEEAKKYLPAGRQVHLVDIGCGRMPYRKELEPLVASYIGVDHPQVSKLYTSDIKPEVLADAKKLPFKKNSFNIALLLQVLEHVDDPLKVIHEAARVLKPGGVLILSVPFFYPLHDMPYDFGRYTETALKSFISEASLNLLKITAQGSFLEFWLQMMNTFLVKRINDMINNFKFTHIFWLFPIIIIAIPVILLNNMLIVIISLASQVFPKYPNYFPLDYLVVTRKK